MSDMHRSPSSVGGQYPGSPAPKSARKHATKSFVEGVAEAAKSKRYEGELGNKIKSTPAPADGGGMKN